MAQSLLMPASESSLPRPRRSACAEAALDAEIERLSRMTIEERVLAALTLRERFDWLRPEPAKKPSKDP